MAVKINASQWREKHNRRLKASLDDIRAGIDRVTESPMEAAAAQADKYLVGVQDNVTKWQGNLRAVPLEEWKRKTRDVGVNRIAAGIDASGDKVQRFAEAIIPHIEAGQSRIGSMPDSTLDDRINRMVSFVRHMSEFRR